MPGPDAISAHVERSPRRGFLDVGDLARGEDRAAALADDGGHRLGDLRVIDDAGGLDQETAQAADAWFAPGRFGLVEPLDVEAVGAGALLERLHAGQFRGLRRHQQLAALLEGDVGSRQN